MDSETLEWVIGSVMLLLASAAAAFHFIHEYRHKQNMRTIDRELDEMIWQAEQEKLEEYKKRIVSQQTVKELREEIASLEQNLNSHSNVIQFDTWKKSKNHS